MHDDAVRATVRAIVSQHSRVPIEPVEASHRLAADLGFDSLAFLLTLSDLEDRVGFHFPVDDDDNLRDISVGELERLVIDSRAEASRGGSRPAVDAS
jgi:acyl carrier protein